MAVLPPGRDHPALGWGRFETLKKKNVFGNLAGIFSLVRGRLRVRTASFRIFSLVLRCVESYGKP